MARSGRFLCGDAAPAVHGALARHLLYDYAIEMRLGCGRSDVAIGGVDPVAFFTKGRTTIGRPDVEASEAGVIWRFENVDNRAFFLAHPEIYGPQFGGYDPVDVARGVAYAGNPRFWLIAGQRLYLFGREESRDAFAADPASVLREARDHWPQLEETLAR